MTKSQSQNQPQQLQLQQLQQESKPKRSQQPHQLKQHRFINALKLQPVDRTPIWLMRQAGRYLPEYRAVREQAGSFLKLCQTPELACEVTLQPLRRFDLDAAIIFSDILTVPDAMGLGLYMTTGEGPCFKNPIQDVAAIKKLPLLNAEQDLKYVLDAIKLVKHELNNKVPLIGFAGSPWTVATYMVEGKSSKNFNLIKRMLYQQPEQLQQLLLLLAKNTANYLCAQIAAGADAVMLFDTWGGILSTSNFNKFSLFYMQNIVTAVKQFNSEIPIILFCKDSGRSANALSQTGAAAVGLDWTADLRTITKAIGGKIALQGNLDPAVLYASDSQIKAEVAKVLENFYLYDTVDIYKKLSKDAVEDNINEAKDRHSLSSKSGRIFNLGHGIAPDVDPAKVAVLVSEVIEQASFYM